MRRTVPKDADAMAQKWLNRDGAPLQWLACTETGTG